MEKLKVLIVEDEIIVAMNIRQQLLKNDYNVLPPVGKGEKAIMVAKIEKPDVIILDIGLPAPMNGLEAAEKILLFHTPMIIFTSGYVDSEFERKIKNMKALLFYKPFNLDEIIEVIEKYKLRSAFQIGS
jgi:two-component system, response regulator PdtaR